MTRSSSTTEDLVRRFRESPTDTELELRLGVSDEERFKAGVSREVFEQLHLELTESGELESDRHWCELVDYHYTMPNGQKVRTRVTYDANCMVLYKTHTVKSPKSHVLIRRCDDTDSCRLAWSLETPLKDPPPVSCIPTYVRVKQRKVFRDRRNGFVVWSYELSKTWAANSRSAVEHLQHVAEPVYEVECELVDESGAYLAAHTDEYVAKSLLMKSNALLGNTDLAELQVVAGQCCAATSTGRGRKR